MRGLWGTGGPVLVVLAGLVVGCGGTSIEEVTATGPVTPAAAWQLQSEDWPWWRGPDRSGKSDGEAVPVHWSRDQNILWMSPVPGRGHASPVVCRQRVFLATADEAQHDQSVVAFAAESGEQVWQVDVHRGVEFPKLHAKNTQASPTVATDGHSVFVAFANHQALHVTALDWEGERRWQTEVGPFVPQKYEYGYAPSPLLHGDLVIVAADSDQGGFLAALHRGTGEIVWRKPRPSRASYSSPVVAEVAGKTQLLISGCDNVASYDPDSGEQLWSCQATTMATCGTMVWEDDLVFASGGYPDRETACIRADGSGEIVWRNKVKCYEQSMLVHDGHLYALNDDGIAFCWNARTGAELWKKRLQGPVSASPVLVGGRIYQTNERGTTFVFAARPDHCEVLAENVLGDECFASPAVSQGRLFLRFADRSSGERQEYLACIAAGAESAGGDQPGGP